MQLRLFRKHFNSEINVNSMSVFRREADENCPLLGHYAASSGDLLRTFRDNLSVPSSGVKNSWPHEDGTDRLPRNVGKKLPLLAA